MKDAAGVKNIICVLQNIGYKDTLIVASAMGKTTNALEQVVNSFFENKECFTQKIEAIREKHYRIIEDLFGSENAEINQKLMCFLMAY